MQWLKLTDPEVLVINSPADMEKVGCLGVIALPHELRRVDMLLFSKPSYIADD